MTGAYAALRIAFFLLMLAVAIWVLVAPVKASDDSDPSGKVGVCHWSQSLGWQVVEVKYPALDGHLWMTTGHRHLMPEIQRELPINDGDAAWELGIVKDQCLSRNSV